MFSHCLFAQPDQVCLRAPVSESLSRLGRDDLQKFAQYLINELPQQILPTAQKLLDDLLSKQNTYINTTSGAPDPTAGASIDEKTSWWLDESQLRDNLGKIYENIARFSRWLSEMQCVSKHQYLLSPRSGPIG